MAYTRVATKYVLVGAFAMTFLFSCKIAADAVNSRTTRRYWPSPNTTISPLQHVPDRGSAPDALATFTTIPEVVRSTSAPTPVPAVLINISSQTPTPIIPTVPLTVSALESFNTSKGMAYTLSKSDDPSGTLTVPQACASAMSDVIRAGYKTKWCHLLIVNAAYVPLLDNWLCRAQELGLFDLLQATVFVSTEPSVLSMLQARELKHIALWNASGAGELKFFTSHYFVLMSKRLHLIQNLLQSGVNVFITEVDQALFQDPLRAVDTASNASFTTYEDTPPHKDPCFGFMGIRPTPALLAGWDRMTSQMDLKPQNEQLLFQKILKDSNSKISHVFVDPKMVWSGNLLKRHKATSFPPGLVMAHANWVVGIKAKVDLLHSKGLWAHKCVAAAAGEPATDVSHKR